MIALASRYCTRCIAITARASLTDHGAIRPTVLLDTDALFSQWPHAQLRAVRRACSLRSARPTLRPDAMHPPVRTLLAGRVQSKLSPDGRYLACVYAADATERCRAVVLRLHEYGHGHGGSIVDTIESAVSIEWATSRTPTLFFTIPDDRLRARKLYRRSLNADGPCKPDVLVYEEPNDRLYLDVSRTKDGRYVTINSNSKRTSEVRLLDAQHPDAAPVLLRRREPGVRYFVEHRCGVFYIVTNRGGTADFKLMYAADAEGDWADVEGSASPEPRRITDLDMFEHFAVVYERRQSDGMAAVRILEFDGDRARCCAQRDLLLPNGGLCALSPGANLDHCASRFQYITETPLSPATVWCCDMRTGRSVPLSAPAAPAGAALLEVRRLHAPAADGASVPMTAVCRRDVALDGRSPLLCEAYGAYGRALEANFHPLRFALAQRGWPVALCHVRGGDELGQAWHDAARLQRKAASMHDLVACVRHLHALGYSQPDRTMARGTSAGGLVVCGAVHRAPELFRACSLRVPFLDVLSAMTDATLPLTQEEYEEWGDPRSQPDMRAAMQEYSPYEAATRLGPRELAVWPDTLLLASWGDPRVPPWGVAKYVARMRRCLRQAPGPEHRISSMLLLSTDFAHGHGAETTSSMALEGAFLYRALRRPHA